MLPEGCNKRSCKADIVEVFPFPNEIRDLLIDWGMMSVFESSFKMFDRVYVDMEDPAARFGRVRRIIRNLSRDSGE